MDFSAFFRFVDLVTFLCEVLLCLATYIITPLIIGTSTVFQNIIFWTILLPQSWGFKVQKIKVWTQYAACWYWKIFSRVWHGHEIIGQENIPESGPALILYYHGAIPVDYYYLVADTFIKKGRTIHSVVDKLLCKLPGFASLMKVFDCEPGSRDSCTAILKAGHLLGISPGGTYEAQLGDNMYKVMWRARDGFAHVVRDAGGSIPIIPVFTQNVREAYKSFNFGFTRPFCVWLFEKTRMPLVPVYGNFPVKLRTFIGSAILHPSTATIEEIRSASLEAMENLIKTHQKSPGNTWRALAERII